MAAKEPAGRNGARRIAPPIWGMVTFRPGMRIIPIPGARLTNALSASAEDLASSPLFAGMPPAEIAAVVSEIGEEIRLAAGNALVEQGAPSDAFYILLEGKLDVVRATEQG